MLEFSCFIAGILVGYLVVSICESYFHRTIGHSSARFRQICRRSDEFGGLILRSWYSHCVVHHFGTFRQNHVTQFSSLEEEAQLRRKLVARGKAHIPASDYGLRIGGPGEILRYVLPTVPFTALVCWLGGGWFSVGSVIPLIVMPLMSEFIHPLLHLTADQARQAAPRLLKPLVATRAFDFLARYHWLHHRQSDVNFNLMPGGDFILGRYRAPTEAELGEMAAIGLSVGGRGGKGSARVCATWN